MSDSKATDNLRALVSKGDRLRKSLDVTEFWGWRRLVEGHLVDLFTRSSTAVAEFETLYGRTKAGDRPRHASAEAEREYVSRLLDKDLTWLNKILSRLDSGVMKPVNRTAHGFASLFAEFKNWFSRKKEG